MKALILILIMSASAIAQPARWLILNTASQNARTIWGLPICSDAPADAQVLTFSAADACWKAMNNAAGFANPLTTRGDLMYQSSTGTTRLALGAAGNCLTSNGTDVLWGNCGSGDMTAATYDPAGKAAQLLATSDLDTDGGLAASSDTKIATQKATKTYVDAGLGAKENALGNPDSDGKVLASTSGGVRSWVPQSASSATNGVEVYSTPGTYEWTVPAGVNRALCRVWAAGGGGGAGYTATNSGAGGSGGGYDELWIAVTPGGTVAVVVGAGGAGGASSAANGVDGGNSSCGGLTVQGGGRGAGSGYAQGPGFSLRYGTGGGMTWPGTASVGGTGAIIGKNGQHATRPDQGGQGAGGTTTARAGYLGANGALGGGGGGSGSYDTGIAATYTVAAAGSGGTNAGAGGAGAFSVAGVITACTAGTAPSGGGGGGASTSGTFSAGCAGAAGRVEIVY